MMGAGTAQSLQSRVPARACGALLLPLVFLFGCATPSNPGAGSERAYSTTGLHTDRLGETRIEVVAQDTKLRVARIISAATGKTVTAAVTIFAGPPWRAKEFETVHEKIRAGGSLGKTFVDSGFAIRKKILRLDVIPIGAGLRKAFGTEFERAKMRVYEFWARKGTWSEELYGLVAEIYPPESANPSWAPEDQAQLFVPTEGTSGLEESLDRIRAAVRTHLD